MANALATQIDELVESAPDAGFASYSYGKLTVVPHVVTWEDKKATRTPLKKGQKIDPQKETIELEFTVNISEFNPKLEFEYIRGVSIRNSSKRVQTDWSEIVQPSLLSVFGKGWSTAILNQPYVEVEDTPQVNGAVSKKTGKAYTTIKFVRVFKNKDECGKAREERYGKSNEEAPSSPEIPQEVIEQVKGLIGGLGRDAAAKLLEEKKPFGNYEADTLMALVP